MPDEIIEELWRIKEGMAREHNHDIRALAAHLQSKKEAKRARLADLDTVNELSETDKAMKPASERFS